MSLTVERRVASDFVLYDHYSDNPYRKLLPAAAHSPALLNAMLAVAARHHSNMCGTSEETALPYKGRSFYHLSHDLQRLGPKKILNESTLAVVMLFLFFETLDGGLDTWKIHLRGARRLIQMCGQLDSLPEGTSSMLRIFINHVTLIDIIGRTLSSTSLEPVPWDINSTSPEEVTAEGLRDGEAYNFLGCPAELLEIIHTISLLKSRSPISHASSAGDSDPDTYLRSCQRILACIDSFSPQAYISTRTDINESNTFELLQLVFAYKCASRIYAVESLFQSITTSDTVAPYHADLRHHLSALKSGSFMLKGAVWPVFVAGTGATNEVERQWVRDQLTRLWGVLPQGNIRNAGLVLEDIWRRGSQHGEASWRLLEKGGRNWLFI
jgi:hypothetical protein